MVSSKDTRTSPTRRTLALAPAASNSRLAPPPPSTASASAKPLSRSTSTPSHGRTRSFLTGLLERSSSSKRLSEPPSRRQPPSTQVGNSTQAATSSSGDAGLRAPGAHKKRLSAPADFKGKASVSLPLNLSPHLSPVTADARPSPASRSSRSSRSSPYLTSKPLPLDGDEKMRLASWDFGDAVPSSLHELDKGKARAFDDADDYDLGEVERPTPAAPGWGGLPPLDDETLSDFGGARSKSMPVLAGTSRLSIASDTSSMIAWAGPSLTSPPLVRPPLVGADTFASRYSIPYHLSPILESDTASDCHLGPVGLSASSPSTCAHEPTTTARPILHIDPPRRPTRMHSDMSMSVYSRQSIALPEREHDGAEAGELDWGEELLSYFSPDTPVAPSRPEPLEGLAIRGAETMPCPTPMSLEGEVVYDPLPAPSVPSQIVLSARPSFSAFAFPSTSSLARTASSSSSEQASYAASPLFDEVRASAALSTFTVATSVFDGTGDGRDGASTPEKDVQGVDGGVWRADWGWEPYRRSAEPEPVVEQGDSAGEPALSPRVLQQPLSSAPASPKRRTPSSTSPPTLTVDLAAARSSASSRAVSPVLLPLAARALRKREKSLPSIPDNASMWSGATGVPVPSGETMHVEVFCTRELVRCGKYGERRVVVERTLLFTEDA